MLKRNLFLIVLLIFIVKWTAVERHFAPCSQSAPYADEFGITHHSMNTYAVACFEFSEKPMEKIFKSETEADVFIQSMPRDTLADGYVTDVEKFKIIP